MAIEAFVGGYVLRVRPRRRLDKLCERQHQSSDVCSQLFACMLASVGWQVSWSALSLQVYYMNTGEIPSELSRENFISSHVKRSPSLWLHNKSRLWKRADLVLHWCLYTKQTHSLNNPKSPWNCRLSLFVLYSAPRGFSPDTLSSKSNIWFELICISR